MFVHPGTVPAGYEFARDYDLARIVGRELDLILPVTRVIVSGLLEELPTLQLVFGHFGGGIAVIKERIEAKSFRGVTPAPRRRPDGRSIHRGRSRPHGRLKRRARGWPLLSAQAGSG